MRGDKGRAASSGGLERFLANLQSAYNRHRSNRRKKTRGQKTLPTVVLRWLITNGGCHETSSTAPGNTSSYGCSENRSPPPVSNSGPLNVPSRFRFSDVGPSLMAAAVRQFLQLGVGGIRVQQDFAASTCSATLCFTAITQLLLFAGCRCGTICSHRDGTLQTAPVPQLRHVAILGQLRNVPIFVKPSR